VAVKGIGEGERVWWGIPDIFLTPFVRFAGTKNNESDDTIFNMRIQITILE